MQIILALLADAANSTDSGKLNLLGAFQVIFAREVPHRYPLFSIVLGFRADSSEKGTEHTVAIQLMDAESKLIYEITSHAIRFPIDTVASSADVMGIYTLQDIIFPQFGNYEFHVIYDGQRFTNIIPLVVQPVLLSVQEPME